MNDNLHWPYHWYKSHIFGILYWFAIFLRTFYATINNMAEYIFEWQSVSVVVLSLALFRAYLTDLWPYNQLLSIYQLLCVYCVRWQSMWIMCWSMSNTMQAIASFCFCLLQPQTRHNRLIRLIVNTCGSVTDTTTTTGHRKTNRKLSILVYSYQTHIYTSIACCLNYANESEPIDFLCSLILL